MNSINQSMIFTNKLIVSSTVDDVLSKVAAASVVIIHQYARIHKLGSLSKLRERSRKIKPKR